MSKDSTIELVPDIGEVVEDDPDDGEGNNVTIVMGQIIGIKSIDTYKSCNSCNTKVEETDCAITKCHKCGMLQKASKCAETTVARLLLDVNKDTNMNVTAFQSILNTIAGPNITPEKIFDTPKLKFVIKDCMSLL